MPLSLLLTLPRLLHTRAAAPSAPPRASCATSRTAPRLALHWQVLALAAWLATVGNLALWQQLWALPQVDGGHGLRFMAGMVLFVLGVLVALLGLLAWPRVLKPVATVLLLSAASATHFMLVYSAVIDSTMLLNVLHTDAKEAGDLLSWRFAATLLVLGVLPSLWLWRQAVPALPWHRRVLANLATVAVGLLVAGLALFWVFQDFASVMRNHKQVRYLINPLNAVYGMGKVVADLAPRTQQPLQPVGEDARLGRSYASASPPPLLVLVVGETARAANFGLGGYGRDTTPQLQALQGQGQLTYFSGVRSCGTNTQSSLPCMFSHLAKADFEGNPQRFENLLDVLQRAGLAVVWVDNQSGCKGLCDRLPTVNTRDGTDPELCAQGDCYDTAMIPAMERALKALPPERTAKGTVVVLHQMGSHGPAYFKRSPQRLKAFVPECGSTALQDCTREEVVNAYDNSLRATDDFLAQTIAWLKRQPDSTGLLYVSDHGESLGENHLYLHGLPYTMAPDEQKRVPMLTWLSAGLQQRMALPATCLSARASQPLTHDHLFHSVLGLMDVQTQVHQPALDLFAPCKGTGAAT